MVTAYLDTTLGTCYFSDYRSPCHGYQTMTRNLTPNEAVERYLKERKPEVSQATWQNHSYTLQRFVEFCTDEDIENINSLDGFSVHEFKIDRREDDISEQTLYNNLCVLRVFLQWCESLGLVKESISEDMILPEAKGVRHETIAPERVSDILGYLDDFEYATLRHALFALLWDTGIRLGAARALDVDDYYSDEAYAALHHRPATGTPLKNDEGGEREVNLHRWVCDILDDYIKHNREDTSDEYDREPLFASTRGRTTKGNLRMHINALTRPCYYTDKCPHDRDISDCEATTFNHAQRCPSSVTPHPIRRSAITYWLNQGHPKELVSDRMNVSKKVLDKHYDERTEEEKRELRRQAFEMSS
ncbi:MULTISPECIES: tyrosine-type recombinase/integrase [Haloferacaceae]|uniref:Tyrosine-type recombinase/integrase n=1 Tax=Halorubrum glutamatedens TaxID=2707018 RepID=A0ABD5QSP1_9EURY|nr:site-specific integrase [Halobellus captivus]